MRLKLIYIGFYIAFVVLLGRLFFWQIVKGKNLAEQARAQHQLGEIKNAPRGNILADDGTWLSAGERVWLIYVYLPEFSGDIKSTSNTLAPLMVENPESKEDVYNEAVRIEGLLSKKDSSWIPIQHKISDETKVVIEKLEIAGIDFEQEETRFYPEASISAHLMGFVGKNEEGEDQGYFGLEGFYDLILSGKPGYSSRESDASGKPILFGSTTDLAAVGGADLKTHIDKSIQLIFDKKLKKGLEKYGAKAGSVVAIEPDTGAILGMSSFPSYDPRQYHMYSDELFSNPVISSSFEPGSVFKVIVMASALDAGVVEPDTKCETCSGPYVIDKYVIETWDKQYRDDSIMVDVIVHSDNVGMVYVANELGIDSFYDYLDKFGLGKVTSIDLQGEFSPKLRERELWSKVDLATASFGQGVAVTPIQLLLAVTAIANDGIMIQPQVVDLLSGDGWSKDIKPVVGERVIAEESAKEMTSMMVEAAKNGEAKWTHLRGFDVAGKTGTAQIPLAGHYDEEKTIASFIGFAPADDPKFVMLVTLREPESSPWASETAAPLWYDIAKELFLYYQIQPKN